MVPFIIVLVVLWAMAAVIAFCFLTLEGESAISWLGYVFVVFWPILGGWLLLYLVREFWRERKTRKIYDPS